MSNAKVLQKKYRRCGRNCSGCPHGPYYYWAQRVNGKVKWTYIGTEHPGTTPSKELELNFELIGPPPGARAAAMIQAVAEKEQSTAPAPAELPGLSFFEAADLLSCPIDRELPKREVLRKRVWNKCKNKSTTPEQAAKLREALEVVTAWLEK